MAALILGQVSENFPDTWRCYDEVFDLAKVGDSLYAATDGGLLSLDGQGWRPVPSPAGIRSIPNVHPFTISLADSRSFAWIDRSWRSVSVSPKTRNVGAVPVPAHVYCSLGDFAGTAQGLYENSGESWTRVDLPSDLPLQRPNGLVETDGRFVVGGLGGLYLGTPHHWERISRSPVRQLQSTGSDAWVVYGNGAVDKITPAEDKRYPDIWFGAAQRPWSSCVSSVEDALLFGGSGGWIERGKEVTEHYPKELAGDVVMAIAGKGSVRWVGTQKRGLVRYGEGKPRVWNPGNGLSDTWVTSLCLHPPYGLIVGTATEGLFLLKGNLIKKTESPTNRITRLCLWGDRLVVGGMDGAWMQSGSTWQVLPSGGEETTALTPMENRELAVVTASGVHFCRV